MAIELKTIDIILATASFVILIIVFFFVFQFRKMTRETKGQEEFAEQALAAPVKLTSVKIRKPAPKQIEKHVRACLKLEDILPKLAGKPDISEIISDVTEIRSRFSYEIPERYADSLPLRQAVSSEPPETAEIVEDVIEIRSISNYEPPEIPAPFKPHQYENGTFEITANIETGKEIKAYRSKEFQDIVLEKASGSDNSFKTTNTNENAELKLEDPLPGTLDDIAADVLKEKSNRMRMDGTSIPSKTAKSRKRSARNKKPDGVNGKDDPKPRKKTVRNMRSFEIDDGQLNIARGSYPMEIQ